MTDAGVRAGTTPRVTPRSWWTDPRLPLVLVPFAVLLAIVAEWSLAHAGVPIDGLVTDLASGLAFIAAGLIAWRQRPGNRVGPLMTGIGFAWFGGDLLFVPIPLIGPLSLFAQASARVLFAWLLLAFPTGELGSRLHRVAIAVIAVAAGALTLLQLITFDTAALCDCPPSPFAVAAGTPLAERVAEASAATGILMTAILVPLVIRRVLLASGPARRTLVPVLAGGLFSLLSVTPQLVQDITGQSVEAFTWLAIVWVALPIGFLIALLNARIARGAVADLVIRLGETPEPEHLRTALAGALGDPTLEVLRWSDERSAFVGSDGTTASIAEPGDDRAVTVLEGDRGRLAAIVHDRALLDDPGLVASVSAAMRLAVENERLQHEVEARLADVQASRARIVTAGDAERRRLERDLHDGAQQRLVALSLALRRAQGQLEPSSGDDLVESLEDASKLVKDALAELRELARGIHPAVLSETGLAGAIPALAARSPLRVDVGAIPKDRLPAEVEAAAYFFVSEALANAAKHAPDATVSVEAQHVDGALTIAVADDGPGGAAPGDGSGLQGLDDRMAAIGGRLEIESPAGAGTTLRAWIPVAPAG